MQHVTLGTQLKALGVLVALVLVVGFAFSDVPVKLGALLEQSKRSQVATASGVCPQDPLSIPVDHTQCVPKGPHVSTMNGQPCAAFVPGPSGSPVPIQGTCQNGCCTGIGLVAPSPFDAVSSFFGDLGGVGSFAGELGKGVLLSGAMQLVGQAFQPGAGESGGSYGSGYSYGSGSQYSSTDVDDSYLQYDSTSGSTRSDNSIDLAYGGADESEQRSGGEAQQGGGSDSQEKKSVGDSITTAYERVRDLVSGGSRDDGPAQLGDGSQFDQDYYGGSGSGSERTDRLTQAELERSALAQRERAAQYESGREDTSGLTDYESSAVARSNVRGNPLATGDDDEADTQADTPGFFARIGNFFARLFGF